MNNIFDRVVQYPNRYKIKHIDADTIELTKDEGTVSQEGTPLNSATFNELLTIINNKLDLNKLLAEILKIDVNDSGINATTIQGVALALLLRKDEILLDDRGIIEIPVANGKKIMAQFGTIANVPNSGYMLNYYKAYPTKCFLGLTASKQTNQGVRVWADSEVYNDRTYIRGDDCRVYWLTVGW